ncbi:MAG: PDDEXK nuclease domain-containing protein [Bacteroidales bacterium]|nr:PDDEXK nuclease domain-containing protein [Bacteroidales bacterium]
MKNKNIPQLYDKIASIINLARKQVATTANLTMVHSYFEIGRMIVEDEQEGETRAEYGKKVLQELSVKLNINFGRGFSYRNMRNMRQFYLVYSRVNAIWQTPSAKFKNEDNTIRQTPSSELQITDNQNKAIRQMPSAKSKNFTLSWSHYLVLMRIENPDERSFYEIEAHNEQWSEKHLKRQYHSSLYERLALSRNKDEVKKLANKGLIIEKPIDILKNPLTLDFLGFEEKAHYNESDLENAIISKLQHFLLELGKGFLFEARQKRFSFSEKSFYVDLVFYNRLLQCYVLIDLKTEELTHQDLGQIQMYVNYYDRHVKTAYEKPSIGILLVKKKEDALVELTLPKDANIYASEYSLYLPEKQLLQQKLKQWIQEFEEQEKNKNDD